jgi:hypothetical protein
MEEMSFRSGVAVGAGGLAVTATAIALLVTLTGHSAAAVSVAGPSAPARSAPAASATPSPSVTPTSLAASPAASPAKRGPASWAPAAADQVAAQTAPSRVHFALPQRPSMWTHRSGMDRPFPIFFPWGGPSAHHGYGAGVTIRRPA